MQPSLRGLNRLLSRSTQQLRWSSSQAVQIWMRRFRNFKFPLLLRIKMDIRLILKLIWWFLDTENLLEWELSKFNSANFMKITTESRKSCIQNSKLRNGPPLLVSYPNCPIISLNVTFASLFMTPKMKMISTLIVSRTWKWELLTASRAQLLKKNYKRKLDRWMRMKNWIKYQEFRVNRDNAPPRQQVWGLMLHSMRRTSTLEVH